MVCTFMGGIILVKWYTMTWGFRYVYEVFLGHYSIVFKTFSAGGYYIT